MAEVESSLIHGACNKNVQQVHSTPLRCLFAGSGDAPKIAGETLTRLSDLYLRVAEERTVHAALIWPGYPSCLPIIHSLSCLRLWDCDSRSIKGLYYPAKKNSFYTLSDIFVDTDILCSIANKIYNSIIASRCAHAALEQKMLFFFGVKSLRKDCPPELARPSLNEIFPHFTIETKEEHFSDYSKRLYMKLRTKIHSAPKKALIERTIPVLGDPSRAPDALFALGYRLSKADLSFAIKEVQRTGTPDVLLLDGTYNAVRYLPDWRKRFVAIIDDVIRIFGDESPGILMVTDEPRQMSLLCGYLKQANHRLPSDIEGNQHGIIHTGISIGIVAGNHEDELMIPQGKIGLHVTDYESGNLIDKFNDLAKSFEDREVDATPVRNAIRFIAKLSHLPGSYDILWDYLNSRSVDSSSRYKFDWLTFQNGVKSFVSQYGALPTISTLQRLMAEADRLVDAYRKATPLSLKVLHEIERHHSDGQKCVTVVRHRLHKAVLSKYLGENNAGDENEVILGTEIEEKLASERFDSIIFADMNAEILRNIVSNPMLPSESILILTVQMAKDLRHRIAPLLNMPDFKAFHGRLAQILPQLDGGLAQGGKPLIDDGFFQPSFSLSSFDDGSSLHIDDREKVLIGIKLGDDDTDQMLVRGKHSQMYVYEPDIAEGEHFGFREIEAGDLNPGQEVFIMSDDLHDEIESVLKNFGFPASGRDAPHEEGLRKYHICISDQVTKTFGGKSSTQMRRLREEILRMNPDLTSELNNLKYWVDLGKCADTPFSELTPHAPRRYRAFKAFCQALRVPESSVQSFWFIIQFIRGIRRGDGRILSEVYSRILFDPESAEAYTNIPREMIDKLRREAMNHVYVVTEVVPG